MNESELLSEAVPDLSTEDPEAVAESDEADAPELGAADPGFEELPGPDEPEAPSREGEGVAAPEPASEEDGGSVARDESATGEPASEVTPDDEEEVEPPEEMCQMLFVDVSLVLPSTHPVVVLQEADSPYRELEIPVGGAEGVAIAYAARQMPTPRPLTHQMISDLLDACDVGLDSVRITSVTGANFVAELVLSGRFGTTTVDCRPSDAIALALRRPIPVPIMVAPVVLEAAGAGTASGN